MRYKTTEFLLIQNQDCYDAIINWQPKDGEFIHPDLYRTFRQTFAPTDLSAAGIPKVNLTNMGARTTVESNYNPKPTQLVDGTNTPVNRWVLNMREAGKWLEFWKRDKDNGGLILDPNGTPRSVSLSTSADMVILGEEFYATIITAMPQIIEE